jgi:hypothetical protein
MFKKLTEKLSNKVHDFVGSWAYFFGAIMADGFQERMDQIHDQECEACIGPDGDDEDKGPAGKPN